MVIGGYSFEYVCDIVPETDDNGNIVTLYPRELYVKKESLPLHKYGKGIFCKFKIPTSWKGKQGVYCLYSCGELVYVGECIDLHDRFNMGYGNISPRNCFKGGQETNCRINNLILNEVKQGKSVKLFFLETEKRIEVEKFLIEKLNPPWNLQSSKNSSNGSSKKQIDAMFTNTKVSSNTDTTFVRCGHYEKLSIYMKGVSSNSIKLTFKEIENVINRNLPPSAYKHRAWWANGGHSHSNYWLNAGWIVEDVVLGSYVVFSKK